MIGQIFKIYLGMKRVNIFKTLNNYPSISEYNCLQIVNSEANYMPVWLQKRDSLLVFMADNRSPFQNVKSIQRLR